MEDQQFPEQVAGDGGGVKGEKRAHKNTRPLTGKHVDTHPPLRRVRGRTHFCQIAKRGHQDTSTRLDSFPLQNFQEKIGKFNERSVFDPDDFETIFVFSPR